MDISILSGELEVKEPPGIDTFDPRFTEITALIHQSDYKSAAERSQEALSEHLFDIRLISYFLYGHFLESGPASLAEVFSCLDGIIKENIQAVGPDKNRDKQIATSLCWLTEQVLKRLENDEKKRKVWNSWLEAFTPVQVGEWHNRGASLSKTLGTGLNSHGDQVIGSLGNLLEWLLAFQQLIQAEASAEENSNSTAEAGVEKIIRPESELPEVEGSLALADLIQKLSIFEILVESGQMKKAAIVADHISHTLENFDPRRFFPTLFASYTRLIALHINRFTDLKDEKETPSWKALEDLLHVDPDGFVDFGETP